MTHSNRISPIKQSIIPFPLNEQREIVDYVQRSQFIDTLLALDLDVKKVQNQIYKTLLGYTEAELRVLYALSPGAKVRDHIPPLSLCYIVAAEETIRLRLTPVEGETITKAMASRMITGIVNYVREQLKTITTHVRIHPATGADAASLL